MTMAYVSASAELRDTTVCLRFQLFSECLPTLATLPLEDLRVPVQPAQSLSL